MVLNDFYAGRRMVLFRSANCLSKLERVQLLRAFICAFLPIEAKLSGG